MTNEEAIKILSLYRDVCKDRLTNGPVGPDPLYDNYVDRYTAFTIAIAALEQQWQEIASGLTLKAAGGV